MRQVASYDTLIKSGYLQKFGAILNALRIRQYPKNILIFVPLLTSQLYTNIDEWLSALTAFGAFCLIASSTYLINDLVDIDADRQHRTKHKRPFASGQLSLKTGKIMATLCLLLGLICAAQQNITVTALLSCYFVWVMLYTFLLKKKRVVDVLCLSGFYVMRILTGIAAIDSQYSLWLLGFSWFFFLSLALVKRYVEAYLTYREHKIHIPGRGYDTRHMNALQLWGHISGVIAVILLCFYNCSDKAGILYQHIHWLWLNNGLLCYWMIRLWSLTAKGRIDEDPVAFVLKDKITLMIIGLMITILFMAGPTAPTHAL